MTAPSPGHTVIFAYGTLQRGFSRHRHLSGQEFLGTARTLPRYRMVNVGTYPGLLDAANDGQFIEGELWSVTPECLSELDEVEGVAERLYARRPVLLEGCDIAAQAYFYLPESSHLPDCGTRWR